MLSAAERRPPIEGPVRLLLVDDHPLMRAGIRASLSGQALVHIVGEAASGEEALGLARALAPDIVLLDLSIPGLGGFEVSRRLAAVAPNARVIVLTMHQEREYARLMIEAGVVGYVLKDAPSYELHSAIEAARRGRTYLCQEVAQSLVGDLLAGRKQDGDRLTPRERQVLSMIAEGARNKEIAARLGVSIRTVETHRERLMSKLRIKTPAGLTRYAIQRGFVALE